MRQLWSCERAKGAGDEQKRLRGLQIRARDGNSTFEDWNLLLSRQLHNVADKTNFENTAVKLSFGNEKVANNQDVLQPTCFPDSRIKKIIN